jgi:hypothetical protein
MFISTGEIYEKHSFSNLLELALVFNRTRIEQN